VSFTSIGSLGTANAKTSGGTLSINPSRTVPVGRLLAIWTAWDQDYTGTPEGSVYPAVAVHDTQENVYSLLGSWMWESHVAITLCRVTAQLTTGDTITVTHRNSNHDEKAMSVWEFSMDTTKVWARNHGPFVAGTFGGPGGGGGDPTVMNVPFNGQEVLILHGFSAMGPETDTYTWDSDYTEIDGDGTTGGSDISNIHIRGGFRIGVLANDTITVVSNTADRAYDSLVVGIYEATYIPDFPRFSILDDFNRANEDPLDGSDSWYMGPPVEPSECAPGYGGGLVALVGNQVQRSAIYAFGAAGAIWKDDAVSFGGYAEGFVKMNVAGQAIIHLDETGCGADATMGGYAVVNQPQYGGYIAGDAVVLGFTGNTGFFAGNPIYSWIDMQDNWSIGIQRTTCPANFLHAWINRGSGWEWIAAWNETSFGPNNIPGQNRLAISVWGDALTRLDDFGGGAEPTCPEFWVGMNWREAQRHKVATRALVNPSDT
jgi:hypothetical protein